MMARTLFFALSLLLCTSCQTEKAEDGNTSSPPVQLTAGKERSAQAVAPEEPEKKVSAKVNHAPQEEKKEEAARGGKERSKDPEQTPETDTEPISIKTDVDIKPGEKNGSSSSQPMEEKVIPKEEKAGPPSHLAWNTLLQKHVSASGKVNYSGLLADKAKLQAYLDELAANPPEKSWSRNERLAYWINAYNAFTVKLITGNYPVSSIMNLKGGKPFDTQWIELGGKTYSLNQIENEIIRPRFNEPRIHFAVNCAAVSCPPLLNEAYTADKLSQQLEQQARKFINNPKYNKISPETVKASKIFEWYAEDFGNFIDYLNKYSETKIQADAKVTYMEYDWALNKQ